jgi:hypothetical protein
MSCTQGWGDTFFFCGARFGKYGLWGLIAPFHTAHTHTLTLTQWGSLVAEKVRKSK